MVSAGTTSGTDVDWYPCNGTAAQGWKPQSNGELVNPSSGLCLTDPGGNTSARLDIETCTGATDQQWTLPTGSGSGTGNTVTVTGPGSQSSTVGTAASLQIKASDSGSGQTLSYGATGLPAGLSINSSTGLISGTPTAAGTSNVTVTARDGTGATGSTSFTWTVSAGGTGGSCGTTNLALNKTATASSTESAAYPAADAVDGNTGTRWSSAFSDPAVAGSRPRLQPVDLPGQPELGERLRHRVPDSDLHRQHQLDHDLLDHQRDRRHPDAERHRHRPLHPDVRDGPGHPVRLRLWEFGVYGTSSGGSGSCGTTNLALNKTTTASSLESAAFPAAAATDGNTGTRWSSGFSDPQWLEVDLGSVQSICQVSLDWENAYASSFQLQTSTDGSTWTTVYSTTSGTGGNQTLNVTGSGRYIRMYGTARATQYGYSLWEFGVHTA